jgi:hypothetical protein
MLRSRHSPGGTEKIAKNFNQDSGSLGLRIETGTYRKRSWCINHSTTMFDTDLLEAVLVSVDVQHQNYSDEGDSLETDEDNPSNKLCLLSRFMKQKYRTCFILESTRNKISARRTAILTKSFRDFSQSLQVKVEIVP